MLRVSASAWAKRQSLDNRGSASTTTASSAASRSTVHSRQRRNSIGWTETSQDSHDDAASSSSEEHMTATTAWDEEANPGPDDTRPAGSRRRDSVNEDAWEDLEATSPWRVTTSARGELTPAIRAMLRKGKFIRYHMFSCWRRHLTTQQALIEINATADKIISQKTISRWYARFNSMTNANVCFRDLPRSGRPPLKLDKVRLRREVMVAGRSTTRQLGRDYGASHTTISRILRQLGFSYRVPHMKPYQLRPDQQARRGAMCADLLNKWTNDPGMRDLVTCDETMLHLCAKQRKSKEWCFSLGTVTKKELNQVRAIKRTLEGKGPPPGNQTSYMLVVFWNRRGVVHHELLEPREKMTAERYQIILRTVARKLRLGRHKKVFLLQDNATSHSARASVELAEELGFKLLSQPPYSPDVAPSDYFLFRAMKYKVDAQAFLTRGGVETAVERFLNSQSPEFWARGIDSLPARWKAIDDAEGDFPRFDENEHLMPPDVAP